MLVVDGVAFSSPSADHPGASARTPLAAPVRRPRDSASDSASDKAEHWIGPCTSASPCARGWAKRHSELPSETCAKGYERGCRESIIPTARSITPTWRWLRQRECVNALPSFEGFAPSKDCPSCACAAATRYRGTTASPYRCATAAARSCERADRSYASAARSCASAAVNCACLASGRCAAASVTSAARRESASVPSTAGIYSRLRLSSCECDPLHAQTRRKGVSLTLRERIFSTGFRLH